MIIAPYACHHNQSKGRQFQEELTLFRNHFQRDRDRIIHSASFRRLQYKTQVFVNHEGDMFRSRLTHSLEVAQIARSVARTLECHEDLAEAIALAHDLGHTPFGHAGQDALNECMKNFGGFEHNLQSLRVVDVLENRYAGFRGLNLTFEVREGILKHCSKKNARLLGEVGLRFIAGNQPSLEAQIVNYTDEIAYIHHDLDDGFRSGILNFKNLCDLDLFNEIYQNVIHMYTSVTEEQILNETIRRMMNAMIKNLCDETHKKIKQFNPQSPDELRQMPPLVDFSPLMARLMMQIKKFSRDFLYQHPRIQAMSNDAKKTTTALFNFFLKNYDSIPVSFKVDEQDAKERVIADYVAGMTDRYANNYLNSTNP